MKIVRMFLICSLTILGVESIKGQEATPMERPLVLQDSTEVEKLVSVPHPPVNIDADLKKIWTVTVGSQTFEELASRLDSLMEICGQEREMGAKEVENFAKSLRDRARKNQIARTWVKEEVDVVAIPFEYFGFPLPEYIVKDPKQKQGYVIPYYLFKKRVEEAGFEVCSAEVAALIVLSIHESIAPTYIGTELVKGTYMIDQKVAPIIFSDTPGNPCVVLRPFDRVRKGDDHFSPHKVFVVKPRKPNKPKSRFD